MTLIIMPGKVKTAPTALQLHTTKNFAMSLTECTLIHSIAPELALLTVGVRGQLRSQRRDGVQGSSQRITSIGNETTTNQFLAVTITLSTPR